MKRLFPLLIFAALVASFALPIAAQQAPISQAFSLTAAGQFSAVIKFSAPVSSCGVVVATGGTFTLVPQSSNDGSTWVTATGINSGSITAVGSYTGGIANTGLLDFRVLLTAVSGGAVTGTVICSNSLARAGGGATMPPLPLSVANGGTGTSSPNPTVTATACAASPSYSGSFPSQTLSVPAGCSAGGSTVTLLPSPGPTSTPYLTQNGYLATQGALFDCNGSLPHFLACPQAIVVGNGAGFAGVCSGYASWGTNLTDAVAGVIGEVAALGCDGPTTPQFTIDSHGDVGVGRYIYSDIYAVYNGSDRIITWQDAASDSAGDCRFAVASGGGIKYLPGSSGTCQFQFQNGPLAHSALGLNASNAVISASTDTELSGIVTCAVSSATSCTTAAVTVRSGAHCLATMDASSTVAGPYHSPVVNNASGSLTVVLTAVTAGTGNLAANYWCP